MHIEFIASSLPPIKPTPLWIYFTTWTLGIITFSKWLHPFINVVFLAVVILMISSYIVHIWPQRLVGITTDKIYELKGKQLALLHLFAHVLPMVWVIVSYAKNNRTTSPMATTTAVSLLALYIALFHPQHVYGVPEQLLGWLFIAAVIAYSCIVL